MITDDLPWEMVLERARSCRSLVNGKEKFRAKRVFEYLCASSPTKSVIKMVSSMFWGGRPRIDDCPTEIKEELSKTYFLPILQKPDQDKWPFPWAADNCQNQTTLAAPHELYDGRLKDLVACHKKVLDNEALGIRSTATVTKVLLCLKVHTQDPQERVQTRPSTGIDELSEHDNALRLDANPEHEHTTEKDQCDTENEKGETLFDIALLQLQTISQATRDGISTNSGFVVQVSTICRHIYCYLNQCIQARTECKETLKTFLEKPVIWTGECFVEPIRAAFKMNHDCRPHRYKIETSVCLYRELYKVFGVSEALSVENLASVLYEMYGRKTSQPLSDEETECVCRVAQQLCESKQSAGSDELHTSLFLPDRQCIMQPVSELCIDDCNWLSKTEHMKFVNNKVSNDVAATLGVKSKRKQDFKTFGEPIPFGQKEKLTIRIKKLLEGYTFDSSLFMELLQNADDAGATEVKFIQDFRQQHGNKVLEGCEKLQGPALCVFNDKSFTKKDIEGIQNLGQGSKGEETLKIGRYGVGFNSVYHLTDFPSFWTLEDGETEAICIFDPNCHLPQCSEASPGMKFNGNRIREGYPDMFAGYLSNCIDMSMPGTLFRFPLRTKEMAEQSQIKREAVTEDRITSLLNEFKLDLHKCLLFLNNVRKIGIYKMKPGGDLELEDEVTVVIDEKCSSQLETFNQHLSQAARQIQNISVAMRDIHSIEVSTRLSVKSQAVTEEWLCVQRVGFKDNTIVSEELHREWHKEHFRLLPRGGVAVKVAEINHGSEERIPVPCSDHRAFCVLPLPVWTHLPLHVNGHFALDHETRRGLWDNKGEKQTDVRTEWNSLISTQIIVPTYLSMLQQIRELWFHSVDTLSHSDLSSRLKCYHRLFPDLDLETAPTHFWVMLRKNLYQQIAKLELPLFPVTSLDQLSLEWMPVTNSNGSVGYFSNLEYFFSSVPDKPQAEKPVVLSQGGVQGPTEKKDNTKWIQENTAKLKKLLKAVNMKVLEAPFDVYANFKSSDVHVLCVCPETVSEFLKSADKQVPGRCNLERLPQALNKTALKKSANVTFLLHFISYQPQLINDLEGLPLSLRESSELYFFHANETKPILSRKFYGLLSGSSNVFLHGQIVSNFCKSKVNCKKWMEDFDIPALVRLLPETLSVNEFKMGACSYDETRIPKHWIQNLWEFLGSHIEEKQEANSIQKEAVTKLLGLMEWSLLPVMREGQPELFPIKDIEKVLFLSEKPDQSNHEVWEALKVLPLPILNMSLLPTGTFLPRIVASISHPVAMLRALIDCASRMKPTMKHALSILRYFSNNLSGLTKTLEGEDLKRMLKSLPLFPMIDGNLTSIPIQTEVLCLENGVPVNGLLQWAAGAGYVLIKKDMMPDQMSICLGFKTPTTGRFYGDFLLPHLSHLPRNNILTHMHLIKVFLDIWSQQDRGIIIARLQDPCTCFLEKDGRLLPAKDFYSPHHPVFHTMCQPHDFPPQPYCEKDWESFMKTCGIKHEVDQKMFLQYARILERNCHATISPDIQRKSYILLCHLYNFQDLTPDFLRELRNIRFVLPSNWPDSAREQALLTIAKPYGIRGLLSVSESCPESHLHLVWSRVCIRHPNVEIHNYKNLSENRSRMILNFFLGQDNILKKDVVDHFLTVCRNLDGESGRHLLQLEDVSKKAKEVMMKLYQYLQSNLDESDVQSLKEKCQALIYCHQRSPKQMLKAENVVIDLRQEEAISGQIEKASLDFFDVFDFFRRLGVADRVTADHYARALATLKERAEDSVLHVEEFKLCVKTAIKELFNCLKSKENTVRLLTVSYLFLPSTSVCLVKSTQLVFIDRPHFAERIKEMPNDMHFFLGFRKLGIEGKIAQNELKLLPKEYSLQFLSDLVEEIIPDEIKEMAEIGHSARRLLHALQNPDFIEVVIRLVFDHHVNKQKPFSDDTVKMIRECISNVAIMEVVTLATELVWKKSGIHIQNTKQNKKAFVDKEKRGKVQCTVYLDKHACESEGIFQLKVCKSLCYAVQHAIGIRVSDNYLQVAFQNPVQVLEQMDEDGLPACDLSLHPDREETVFPPPGLFIPVDLHCYLDNTFSSFYEGEHVGFEAYDPQIDENGEMEDNNPVYIYAIVVKEVKGDDADEVPLLSQRYLINLGPERGEHVVPVTKLYKFVRKSGQNVPASGAVVQYQGEAGPSTPVSGHEQPAPMDFKKIMKEIKELLMEAWRTLDERERNRVVKRLYLKWHPDKNRGNETFCTRVVQRLQHYVQLLKDGKSIPDETDDEDCVDGASSRPRRPPSPDLASFFDNMNRRSRAHRDHFGSYSGSGFSASSGSGRRRGEDYRFDRDDFGSFHYNSYHHERANPQPGEGRRWFKQAEADLDAAQAARGTCSRGHNWICFQCHQGVEKAFKAVLYYRDANSPYLKEHDLSALASAVGDSILCQLARELEGRVGNHMRMRYPDVLVFPKIPADVYTDDHASLAVRCARQALERVRTMLED